MLVVLSATTCDTDRFVAEAAPTRLYHNSQQARHDTAFGGGRKLTGRARSGERTRTKKKKTRKEKFPRAVNEILWTFDRTAFPRKHKKKTVPCSAGIYGPSLAIALIFLMAVHFV